MCYIVYIFKIIFSSVSTSLKRLYYVLMHLMHIYLLPTYITAIPIKFIRNMLL